VSNFIKPILALLISILVFAGFTYLTDIEILDFVEARFYNPSIFNSYVKENSIDADIAEDHIYSLQKKFEATLSEPAVQSSFLYNQSAEDIFERSRIFGILLETTSGLQTVQFVDSNGLRIHYSTSVRDVINQSVSSTAYRNYNEDPLALPYDMVSVPAGSSAKIIMDDQTDRIIFSFPFNDSMEVYRGTVVFCISVRALAERLVAEGRLKVNEDVSVIGTPRGILLGSPSSSKSDILKNVSVIWENELPLLSAPVIDTPLLQETTALQEASLFAPSVSRVVIDAGDSGVKYSLISQRTQHGFYFGRLVNDYLFSIPDPMKLILRLSMYITFYLTLFFLFNIKPNAVTLVRNRVKRLRDSLFEQLFVNKPSHERAKWIIELEQRRDEIRTSLKRHLRLGKRQEKTIDEMINKSWDELLLVIKSGCGSPETVTVIKYRPAESTGAELLEEIEEIIEEAEEIEDAESIEEAEEIDEIDEIEEINEIEEIEEIEEISSVLPEDSIYDELQEIIDKAIAADKVKPPNKIGLLKLAEGKWQILFDDRSKKRGLLARAKEKSLGAAAPANKTASSGLLLRASMFAKKPSRKGLLALASEIEAETEEKDQFEQDLFADINVVSPFSSMFSSLKSDKKK